MVVFRHIGRRHTIIVNDYENTEVIAVVVINDEINNNELFPKNTPQFKTLEELYPSGLKSDVVNIATPNGTHCELAVQAFKSTLRLRSLQRKCSIP